MWNISHVRIVVRNWIPKRFFSETWSILLKIFSKIFLSSQKWMLARKNSCHKMKRSKNGWHHSGHTFFHSEQRGKSTIPLTVTPLIRSILLNSLPKVAPIDVDSVDAFSYQLCHIEPDGLVCHIAANRYSCTQTLNCPCISWTVKVLTSQPPDSIGVALSIKTSLAASLSR